MPVTTSKEVTPREGPWPPDNRAAPPAPHDTIDAVAAGTRIKENLFGFQPPSDDPADPVCLNHLHRLFDQPAAT